MRLVLNASQTGMWIVDMETMYIHWSPQHYKIFGVSEFDGSIEHFQKMVHPDDLQQVWEAFSAAIEKGGQYLSEFRIVHPSGEVRWVSNMGHCEFGADGKPIRFLGTVHDITERKQAEEAIRESERRFRTMAETLPQMVWTIEADGSWSFASKQWREYSGIDDLTTSWNYMVHPEDMPLVMENWSRHFADRKPYRQQLRLRSKTGEYRWHNSVAEPLLDGDGRLLKWVGTMIDIHAEKTFSEKLEELVAERTKELKHANEDLQQFVHVSSHDLKEPVRKTLTFASRLEMEFSDSLPDRALFYIGKISSAARRSHEMIEGVLRYSMLSTATHRTETVDLKEMLHTIESDMELAFAANEGRISYGHLPVVVGYRPLLHQLFYNLLANALKFAKEGRHLELQLDSTAASASDKERLSLSRNLPYVRIRIQDNGIGFAQRYATRIFDTFARLHPKEQYEGVGLGLALCKKIVERHGGAMEAEGQDGAGATFYVYLPPAGPDQMQ